VKTLCCATPACAELAHTPVSEHTATRIEFFIWKYFLKICLKKGEKRNKHTITFNLFSGRKLKDLRWLRDRSLTARKGKFGCLFLLLLLQLQIFEDCKYIFGGN
jgi:hypothetical protein